MTNTKDHTPTGDSESCASLVAKLYAEYNAGRIPMGIRMHYQTWLRLMLDDAFNDGVELPCEGRAKPTFQGLPITFDDWCKQPKIETRPRAEGE